MNRKDFDKLKEGFPPSEIGMDYSEAIKALCEMVEEANNHLHRVNILRKKYLKLDEFICDQVMMSCLAIKGGISEKESIANIFKFYENNCT